MTAGGASHALLVILADDYGDASRGPSFEYETFVPALRRFFKTVTVFPQDRELRARGYFGAASALTSLVARARPDVLFCVPFENQVDWEAMRQMSEAGTRTVAWMCDDQWRWDQFSRHIAPCFSAVVTTDRHAYAAYHGIPGVVPILSQWGVDTGRLRSPAAPRHIPVSFVGARRPHREQMVQAVQDAGIELVVRGSGWPEGRATTEELIEIPARSLISLNFSDSSRRHRRGTTQVKARLFELAASGSCVVTEPDPQLSVFYDPGSEVVVVDGPRELVRALTWLLSDEQARVDRADAAWHRTVREHTYDVRLSRIFAALGLDVSPNASEGDLCVTR